MDVTSTILYPTTTTTTSSNTLDSRQRIRLVRSARKLGAILGTTPQVAGVREKIPVSLLPIGASRPNTPPQEVWHPYKAPSTASSSSASSSMASLQIEPCCTRSAATLPEDSSKFFTPRPKIKARKTKQVPAPLVLRYNAVPVPPSDPRARAMTMVTALPDTPSTADTLSSFAGLAGGTTTVPLTPVTPTQSETRRKRMAKLTRTLGENIPPELVLGFGLRSKSKSAPSVLTQAQAQPQAQVDDDAATMARRRRSMSVDLGAIAMQNQAATTTTTTAAVNQKADDARSAKGAKGSPVSPSSKMWATGSPGSWMGEWNRRDIRDVQKQLRALKAR